MDGIEKLKEMKGKAFLYNNETVVIENYCDGTGEDGDDIEIYLNTGKTLEWKVYDLPMKLSRFQPVTNTVIVLANERLNQVSSVNPAVIQQVRDIILNQIMQVKEDPGKVNQAKQVFQGVNTLINLSKAELEYRKYIDKNNINYDSKRIN
jgi:hypothetical protein